MAGTLDARDVFGELNGPRYTSAVRAQFVSVSAATIDQMLAPTKKVMVLRGVSTTRAGSMLRSSIPIRRAGAEPITGPGFGEIDLVAHCGG